MGWMLLSWGRLCTVLRYKIPIVCLWFGRWSRARFCTGVIYKIPIHNRRSGTGHLQLPLPVPTAAQSFISRRFVSSSISVKPFISLVSTHHARPLAILHQIPNHFLTTFLSLGCWLVGCSPTAISPSFPSPSPNGIPGPNNSPSVFAVQLPNPSFSNPCAFLY